MARASTDPRRGEVWLVSLGAGRRGEPGKNRPAIVVSVDELNVETDDQELVVVVPLSTSRSKSALRPTISPAEGVENESVAIPRAIRAVAKRRLLHPIGAVRAATLTELERSLAMVLGLEAGS